MTLGTRLLALRSAKGLSLREVAAESGVSPSTLSRAERDLGTPDTVTLVMLEDFYGASLGSGLDVSIPAKARASDADIFDEVRAELSRARTRYPWWPSDMVHAAAVASEESGEVVKAVNNYFWSHGNDTLDDIRKEAIQAIAMWTRFLTETSDMDTATRRHNLQVQAPQPAVTFLGSTYGPPDESEQAREARHLATVQHLVNGGTLAELPEYIRPRPTPEQLDKLVEIVRQSNSPDVDGGTLAEFGE